MQYIYEEVIEDVLDGVQELFLDNGIHNSVLQQLKQMWRAKLFKSNPWLVCNELKTIEAKQSKNEIIPAGISSFQTTNKVLDFQIPFVNLDKQSMSGMLHKGILNNMTNLPQMTLKVQNQINRLHTSRTKSTNSSTKILSKTSRYKVYQIDGLQDSSDEDDSISEEEKYSDRSEPKDEKGTPLNSDDDITEGEDEGFNTENIIVCQYEKIVRRSNKWKFYLKSGIMNLDGRDHIFKWLTGEADW